MLLKYFYDKALAQSSYMVGCLETGDALIIDPSRDVTPYLEAARQEGLRITHITETHIHADFVSGSRELVAKTGARLYLSDMGDDDWKYAFIGEAIPLHDGDSWMMGNIRIEVIHTPGHTPEHLVFQITDTLAADAPMGLFTGDFLFVGDVGRPDLLETAAGVANSKEDGARQQFANIQRFKTMPDYLQIWPGHGAGSACGKALGAVPSTTLGYEKLFNPAFQQGDEAAFVRWLLEGQPETPRYFAHMKHVNKVGPALLDDLQPPPHLNRADLDAALKQGVLVIDTRRMRDFAKGHVPGTLGIPATSDKFSTYAGWFVDYDAPTYLIADETEIEHLLRDLRAIGVDNLAGYFTPEVVTGETQSLKRVSPPELAERMQSNHLLVVDVRGASERDTERIASTRHIPLGYLPDHLSELPTDADIVLHCTSGVRSQVAASLLQKHGFTRVANLAGGIDAWKAAGLPLEE
jgi:hydroxyacylglutathione hydrolase